MISICTYRDDAGSHWSDVDAKRGGVKTERSNGRTKWSNGRTKRDGV
jgi:hypothetical protein